MNPILSQEGEISLLVNDERLHPLDGLEPWQMESMLLEIEVLNQQGCSGTGLSRVDKIVDDWLAALTQEDWSKIRRRGTLYGVKIPEKWVQVWRFILKTRSLRNPEWGYEHDRKTGTMTHLWNIWATECIDKYCDEIDKELIQMNDSGLTHHEIGVALLAKYGEIFWRPRKENPKTTPAQVVSYHLYQKIPRKIAKKELLDICLLHLHQK